MRAIIKCTSNIEPEGLDAFLMENDWWPALPQDHPEVQAKKQEILKNVADEDLAIVENTFQYTIYDEATKSWGIVSKPTKHGVTFRIKNRDSERLKASCEKLVHDLGSTSKRKDRQLQFTFISKVEVLEPNSTEHAFSGEVLPQDHFALAIQEKRGEFIVGLVAAIVSLVLLAITFPTFEATLLSGYPTDVSMWAKGFLERLATSAIVTATVSLLNVFLHWFTIRRMAIIRWLID